MERHRHGMHARILLVIALWTLLTCERATCKMHVITDDNWRQMLDGQQWFVEFYAPWCGACKAFGPTWDRFATTSEDLGVNIGKADITQNGGLAGRFMISQLPTLYHVNVDGELRKFTGSRRLEDLKAFIVEEKWKEMEPVVWYQKPDSYSMEMASMLSYLGTVGQSSVQHLRQQYGLPDWALVVIVIILTLLLGVTIGLLGNLVIEKLFFRRPAPSGGPPVTSWKNPPPQTTEGSEDSESDDDEEEKKDK